MKILLSARFIKSFQKIKRKNPKVISKIREKIRLFKINPVHPSLRLHKLKGKQAKAWSFWIEEDLRIIFIYIEEGILFVNIGSHKEVY